MHVTRVCELPDDLRERLVELFEDVEAAERAYAASGRVGAGLVRLAWRVAAWHRAALARGVL
jgi:hypothetical protein